MTMVGLEGALGVLTVTSCVGPAAVRDGAYQKKYPIKSATITTNRIIIGAQLESVVSVS